MIATLSTCIVRDLGEGSFSPVNGLAESKNVKPMTVLLEKVPGHWKPFKCRSYVSSKFLISDILSGDTDTIRQIGVTRKNLPGYSTEKEQTISAGMKYSFSLLKELPGLKAEAKFSKELTMKIISGGFEMVDVDEAIFEKEMRGRTVEMDHAYIKSFLGKPRRNLCVIKAVVLTLGETVVEFNSSHGMKGGVSAEYLGQGATVSADGNSRTIGKLTLEAGSVLACQWQQMIVDKNTGKINLAYGGNDCRLECRLMQGSAPKHDPRFNYLQRASEEEIKKLRKAIGTILKSSSDIEILLDMIGRRLGYKGFNYEVEQFNRELKNRDAVWSVLELIGYRIEDNHIKVQASNRDKDLLRNVIEAISLFNSEELEFISACDTYQIEKLLSIVEVLTKRMSAEIPMEPKFIKAAQKEPVKNVLEFLEINIDLEKGEVFLNSDSEKLEPMLYLLHCL